MHHKQKNHKIFSVRSLAEYSNKYENVNVSEGQKKKQQQCNSQIFLIVQPTNK